MLTNPPCIRGLIGCDESTVFQSTGDTGGGGSTGGSGSSGRSSTSGGGFSGSSSGDGSDFSASSYSRSSSSSSAFSFGTSNGGSNLAARLSSGKERIAQYTVSAVNRGTQAVKGFVFSHGPLPNGAIFDPSRSSKECVQVGSAVQCATDLQPGESKNFEMAYKVNNSLSCAIARVLQSVKNITVGSSQGVVTSVNCSMKTESGSAGQLGANGAGAQVGIQSGISSGTGMSMNGGSGSAVGGTGDKGVTMLPLITLEDQGISRTVQYNTQMPRTGAADVLFQSATTSGVLTKFTPDVESGFSQQAFMLSIVFGVLVLTVLLRRALQRA